jgi:outer membrane lipoprotein-sorting protein
MCLRDSGYMRSVASAGINCIRRVLSQQTPASTSKSLTHSLIALLLALIAGSALGCSPSDQPSAGPLSPTLSSTEGTQSPDAVAAEFMKEVVATYRALSTYSDKGTSIVRLGRVDSTYTIEFETLFKRPDKLRFAWTQRNNHTPGYKQSAVIWSDGATAWALASFRGNKPEQKKNLDAAVAAATGASWGTANKIPRLLSDEVGGLRLDEIKGSRVSGPDTADGVECVVIVGYLAIGTERETERRVWIGREDHLIRRIEERWKTGTTVEARRQIVTNEDIADSRFSEQGSIKAAHK